MQDVTSLRQQVERLAAIPSFNIWAVQEDGEVAPWYEVTGALLVDDLLIHETDLARDVQSISVQIMHWGRLEAQARRVWEIEERGYRIWRDQQVVRMCSQPLDDAKWKRPPEYQIEASYRAHPNYAKWQARQERAEEAYTCARLVREAFMAKRDMLRVAVRQAPDQSGPRLSV